MTYFCDVHLQSKKDQEKRLFIVIPDEDAAKMEIPNLTKELLRNNTQYQEFVSQYKPKVVMVQYTVYSTSAEGLYASTPDDDFLELLDSGNVQKIAGGELAMDSTLDRLKGRRRRGNSPVKTAILIGCIVIVAVGGFGFGSMFGRNTVGQVQSEVLQKSNEDGMLIPEQQEIDSGQEQITISIDRSYSAGDCTCRSELRHVCGGAGADYPKVLFRPSGRRRGPRLQPPRHGHRAHLQQAADGTDHDGRMCPGWHAGERPRGYRQGLWL